MMRAVARTGAAWGRRWAAMYGVSGTSPPYDVADAMVNG